MATLAWPSIHACPLAPKAAEANPTTNASTIAKPTTAEVALPTHNALLTAPLNMPLTLPALLLFSGAERRANAPPRCASIISIEATGAERIPQMDYLW